MHFGPPCDNTPSLLTSGHAVEPRGSTTVTGLNQSMDTPVRFVQVGSPGYGQLEPHRLARFARPGTPADAGARDELETPAALVLGAGTRSRGGSGSGSETSTRSTSPGPLGRTSRTPIGPVACRNALVTSSLTSSAAMSASASSSQSRNWPRTAERAARTAPGPRGTSTRRSRLRCRSSRSHPGPASTPMSDFMGLMGTYPISRARYRPQGRTVARTAYAKPDTLPDMRDCDFNAPRCRGGRCPRGAGVEGGATAPAGRSRRQLARPSACPGVAGRQPARHALVSTVGDASSARRGAEHRQPPGSPAVSTAGGGLSGPGCRAARASRVRRGRPGRARRPSRCRRG